MQNMYKELSASSALKRLWPTLLRFLLQSVVLTKPHNWVWVIFYDWGGEWVTFYESVPGSQLFHKQSAPSTWFLTNFQSSKIFSSSHTAIKYTLNVFSATVLKFKPPKFQRISEQWNPPDKLIKKSNKAQKVRTFIFGRIIYWWLKQEPS